MRAQQACTHLHYSPCKGKKPVMIIQSTVTASYSVYSRTFVMQQKKCQHGRQASQCLECLPMDKIIESDWVCKLCLANRTRAGVCSTCWKEMTGLSKARIETFVAVPCAAFLLSSAPLHTINHCRPRSFCIFRSSPTINRSALAVKPARLS